MVTTTVKTFRLGLADDERLTELMRKHGVGLRELVRYLCITGIPDEVDVRSLLLEHKEEDKETKKLIVDEEKERYKERMRAVREDERARIRKERESAARDERVAKILGAKAEVDPWMKDLMDEI